MAVIINELEIVLEPPKEQQAPREGQPASSPAPPLNPQDLAEILERRARYEIRLMAH